MKIDNLYASAWENAINETAEFLNSLNKFAWRNDYNYANDWHVLEAYAAYNNFEFDEDGYLKASPRMQDIAQIEDSNADVDIDDTQMATVHRIAPDDYDTVAEILDKAGCWYEYDDEWDRIMLLEDGLDALDAAGVEYTEV